MSLKSILTTAAVSLAVVVAYDKVRAGNVPGVRLAA